MQVSKPLPDITKTDPVALSFPLQWVGMEDIAVPLTFNLGDNTQQTVAAKAGVYVSLDKTSAKGIHMSRLHRLLNQLAGPNVNKEVLDKVLENMVSSQEGISQNARLNLTFDLLLPKSSLLSDETGFQTYPVEIDGTLIDGTVNYSLKFIIPYSSTCPCSAALARQLFADAIDREFPTPKIEKQALLAWTRQTSVATPHSQRSYAYLTLKSGQYGWPSMPSIIRQIEKALKVPVQSMVKRADEQEFARLNAENLMFCEDAARNIKKMLAQSSWILDYTFKVEHQESLHAHNAVVIDGK